MVVYYFSSQGRWIAFRENETGKNLFGPRTEWLGWPVWDGQDVCGAATKSYLGTLVGDRLLRKASAPSRVAPFAPFAPSCLSL
ncbi:hypothetical protein OIU93_19140 [Paeniglutamicibacter sp. ZC-3]|uniref:hypothetical protein n=1 Tax=Paeniglutamicibacter sp. ZC-3 TaxID=2986919 RepID=UPI0021F74EF0|nr:hypothetical protein [Paeniglutamicibacter sp. ZC-3]MCV9996390.1 hypothetical protein [Paeniglutamicibacter sp. ZC-3]